MTNLLPTLWPEILLTSSFVFLLLLDLVVPQKKWLLFFFACALAATGLVLLKSFSLQLPQVASYGQFPLFVEDGLSLVLKLGILLVSFLVLLASLPFLDSYEYQGEFIFFLNAITLSLFFLCSAADWTLLYLSLELTSIVSYILAGYRREARSTEAAMKYFLLGAVCSAFMVFGLALLYGITGTTTIATMSSKAPSASLLAFLLIFVGFGFKLAAFPFHLWAPDAYEGAPTPITAFYSVGPKIGAFAILLRAVWSGFQPMGTDWMPFLTVCAIFSMTLGNLVAIHQTNIKRMLAYSTIAHMGYILVGFLSIQPTTRLTQDLGFQSVIVYLFAYLFMNLGLFAAVMAVEDRAKTEAIPQYAGLAQRNPFLAFTAALFLLSLTGIPPLAGFVGKFWIFSAAIHSKLYALALVMGVNSVVSAYYYLNVIREMYLLPPTHTSPVPIASPLFIGILTGLAGTLFLGLYPSALATLATRASLFF